MKRISCTTTVFALIAIWFLCLLTYVVDAMTITQVIVDRGYVTRQLGDGWVEIQFSHHTAYELQPTATVGQSMQLVADCSWWFEYDRRLK